MLRPRLPLLLFAALSLAVALPAAPPRARPTPTPSPTAGPRKTPPPRVFTNDDLEAMKDKPAAVQNLTATGGETSYEHADSSAPAPEPTPPVEEQPTPEQVRIKQLEEDITGLDAQAKQLLWQYLQSTDTAEILRLKAEQKEILDQLDAARVELANLRTPGASQPTPEATPPPG